MTVGNLRKMDVGKVTFMVDGKSKLDILIILLGVSGLMQTYLPRNEILGPIRYDLGSLMSIIREK